MDFISQFETTLENAISHGQLKEANQLISAFPSTHMAYTQTIYRLINRLRKQQGCFSRIII